MSYSARGDREHCTRITTARQKNQHFRAVERDRTRVDTRCSDLTYVDGARDATLAAIVQCNARFRADALKISITQGFFRCRRAADHARRILFASRERARKSNATIC